MDIIFFSQTDAKVSSGCIFSVQYILNILNKGLRMVPKLLIKSMLMRRVQKYG